MRRFSLLVSGVVFVLAAPALAQAPEATLLREARTAEAEHRPADAVALYERAIEAAPTSRLATRARRRLDYLRARSEGDYAPLAAFQTFRDRLPAGRTASVIDSFEREARAFPEGRVRCEAWLAIGEAWLDAEHPARAEAAYRALLDEAGRTESERVTAQTGIARALAMSRGASAGAAHLEEVGLEATSTHGTLAREAERSWGRIVAWALLIAFALCVVVAGRRELVRPAVLRRAFSLPRVLVAAYVVGFPVWLAQAYDHDALDTFSIVAVSSGVLLGLASWVGEALRAREATRGARIALAALCVTAELSIAYLALDRAGQLLSFA